MTSSEYPGTLYISPFSPSKYLNVLWESERSALAAEPLNAER
jgi:hypothetical protein